MTETANRDAGPRDDLSATLPIRRQALTIGVSGFQPVAPGEPLEPLTLAAGLVPDLAAALQNLGFETEDVVTDTLTTAALGALITDKLESAGPDDLLLVHVISHGQAAAGSGDVYVLGSDGSPHATSAVANWLTAVQNVSGRPRTLFLLDLCSAGVAARLPWQNEIDPQELKGWVIAACQSRQMAYDGRFTTAVINVLRSVQDGALDVSPGDEHVPLRTVATAIHREVNRLVTEADAFPQQVTATQIDMSVEPDLPFFRNPTYVNDSRDRLRTHLEPGLLPFLDDLHEGLDIKHFLDRAAGVGGLEDHADGMVGCFRGRERELRRLSPWMNGVGQEALSVVTGSPGVGKSALLGILVCAGHPQLRQPTKPLWDSVAQAPYPVDGLAAVHARSRDLGQIVESIAAQLGLPSEVSAVELVSLLSERTTPAVVVLDALDEADSAKTILDELLLPMAEARRVDGSAAVRLLVGLRHYAEFRRLLALARDSGLFVDLDDVPGAVLEDDLNGYLTDLLRAVPRYRHHGGIYGAFASEVARVLATAREDDPGRRWGPFLVAGLYTRHLIMTYPEPSRLNLDLAGELGANVPTTLPEVLELHLNGQLSRPWLRPIMAVLAQARGQGMPITIIARVVATLDTNLLKPTLADVRGSLGELRVFLRQSTDTDRTTVYRLFHQGLVDHLSAHPFGTDRTGIDLPGVLLDALLAPLGPAHLRDWEAAEPYLFRHALDHAAAAGRIGDILTDPAYLLHPRAAASLAELGPAQHPVLALRAELHPVGGEALSRDALALAAARHGLADLARRAAALPLPAPMSWQPRWTLGLARRTTPVPADGLASSVDDAVELRQHVHAGAVRAMALSSNSRMLVSRGRDTWWSWDLTNASHRSPKLPMTDVVGLSADGRHLALGAESDSDMLLIDLMSGVASSELGIDPRRIKTVAVKTGGTKLLTVDVDGTATVWVPVGGAGRAIMSRQCETKLRSAIWEGTYEDLGPFVVAGGANGAVTLWNVRSGLRRLVARHPVPVVSVAIGGGGRSVVSADKDGGVRVWTSAGGLVWSGNLGAKRVSVDAAGRVVANVYRNGRLLLWDTDKESVIARWRYAGAVTTVALGADAQVVVIGDEFGTIGIWRPASTSRRRVHPHIDGTAGSPSPISAVAVELDGVLVGDEAGLVRGLHLENGELNGQKCVGSGAVRIIASQRIGETYLTRVSWTTNKTILWDRISGTVIDAGNWFGLLTEDQIKVARCTVLLRDRLVEVIGQTDGTVHLRGMDQLDTIGALPGGHDGPVTAVTCGLLGGRPIAFTGSDDGTVRVWDLLDQRMVEVIHVSGPVFGISYAHGEFAELLVGAGGEVIAFRHAGSGAS